MKFISQSLLLSVLFSSNAQQIVRNAVIDAEITALSEELWKLDSNNVAHLITINVQGQVAQGDNAPLPLLTVPPAVYQKPTILKLIALLDNYVPATNVSEVVTPKETAEETAFLDAVLATPVMQKVADFLIKKQLINSSCVGSHGQTRVKKNVFRNKFKHIWFDLFALERNTLSSSGFEHVFVGELRAGEVMGVHNWISFARQEASHAFNYLGFFTVLPLGNKGMILKYSFSWNGTRKPVNGMFIGTSPEFEMALFTLCYYAQPTGRCLITLNGESVPITVYNVMRDGKKYISSAFPQL